jgi:uncharacterized RDD family membrane protein YckC
MSEDRNLPYVLATPQHRLAGRAVDYGFYFVTFGIGWIIWNLIVWTDGRTPGHQVLKMRVYSTDTKKPASWGHMALRQIVLPFSYGIISFIFIGIGVAMDTNGDGGKAFVSFGYLLAVALFCVDAFWIFKSEKRQRVTDIFAKTAVLNESIKADISGN